MKRLIVFLLLSGCVSAEEAARMDFARLGKKCEVLGIQKDTKEYRDCVLSLYKTEVLENNEDRGVLRIR